MTTWESIPTGVKVWVGSLSALTFICSLIVIPVVIVQMAPDYFMPERQHPRSWVARHPVLRWAVLAIKNILGVFLVIIGLILSIPLVPGQGLLTILLGLVLMNFPGKRATELWIIRRTAVLKTINWIRGKADRQPLELPENPPANGVLES